ncbi:MAG: hypothetical protein NUV76_10850 [Candidatus Kuenenia sp.]|nr:hypothetical protein [Candidatus Kuenenia sp.]
MEFVSYFVLRIFYLVLVWFWLCRLGKFNIFVETHCMRLETAVRKENVDTTETHAMRLYININDRILKDMI